MLLYGFHYFEIGTTLSCIYVTLVPHLEKNSKKKVYRVSVKTATSDPVNVVGRVFVHLGLAQVEIQFPAFVATGLGNSCTCFCHTTWYRPHGPQEMCIGPDFYLPAISGFAKRPPLYAMGVERVMLCVLSF